MDEAIKTLDDYMNCEGDTEPVTLDSAIIMSLEALKLLSSADFGGGAHTFKGQSVERCIFIRRSDLEAGPFANLLKE